MVFSRVLRECGKEVRDLCDFLPDKTLCTLNDSTYEIPKMMPYKNCGVNVCLIAISSIPRGQQLAPFPHLTDRIFHHNDMSAKCRETITNLLQAEYVVKVMERGPANFRE